MPEESAISLLHRVSGIISKYDSIAAITGENFNVFNILQMDSNEVKLHSALIAELLNPIGKHGCENLFLNHFLDSLEQTIEEEKTLAAQKDEFEKLIDVLRKKDIKVEVEKWIGYKSTDDKSGGRIDIIVRTNDGYAIVIENKISAGDQRGQLRRYYTYCNDNFHKKPIVVYLTLNGDRPDDYTTCNTENCEKITAVCINYRSFIIGWLEKCRKDAVSFPILRETITQYIYLLKQLTHQTINENMSNEIASLVAGNFDFIKSAESIWDNQNEIKLQIVANLAEELKTKAKTIGFEFDTRVGRGYHLGEGDTGFGFALKDKPYWIYFYFKSDCNNLEVGIDWFPDYDKNLELGKKIRDFLNLINELPQLTTDNWIWGYNFNPWSKATWVEKLSIMPDVIIDKTKELKKMMEDFDAQK